MVAETARINISEKFTGTSTIDKSRVNVCSVLPTNALVDSMSPVTINSVKALQDTFGMPTEKNYKYWYNIYNFLQYDTDGCYIVKPTNENTRNYYTAYNNGVDSIGFYDNIYNTELAEKIQYQTITDDIRFIARHVTNTSTVAVAMCSDANHYRIPITDEEIYNIHDTQEPKEVEGNVYFLKRFSSKILNKINDRKILVEGNLTYLSSGNLVSFPTEIFFGSIDTITSNDGQLSSVIHISGTTITLAGEHDYLLDGDVIYTDDANYTISTVVVSGGFTMVVVTSADGLSIGDVVRVGTDTTTITLEDVLSSTPSVVYHLDSNITINVASLSESIYKKCVYSGGSWTISDIDDGYYHNLQNGSVMSLNGGVISNSNLSSSILNSQKSILGVYNNFYSGSNVASFATLFNQEPNWDNGEFVIAVFVRSGESYSFVKGYHIKDKDDLYDIYKNDKYIYVTMNDTPQTTNTNSKSIMDLLITNNTAIDHSDMGNITPSTLVEINDIMSNTDKYNIDFFMGYQYHDGVVNSMDIPIRYSAKNKRSTTIISPWDETLYLGETKQGMITKLLNNFGNNTYTGKIVTNFSSYLGIYNNMKLQGAIQEDRNIWLPVIGDITGILVENSPNSAISGSGFILKNTIQLLVDVSVYADRKRFNEAGINTIGYDVDNSPIIKEAITATREYDSLERELYIRRILNSFKNYINRTYYIYLMKLVDVDNILAMRSSMMTYLNNIPAIESAVITPGVTDGVVNFTIDLTFVNKVRTINFNITVDNSGVIV